MAFISAQPVMNGIFSSPEESAVVQQHTANNNHSKTGSAATAAFRKCSSRVSQMLLLVEKPKFVPAVWVKNQNQQKRAKAEASRSLID